jgi:hypothetical protein
MINILQIIVSVLLIGAIIIQDRSSGVSGILGGQGATPYETRRGLEKIIFYITIVLAIALGALSIINLA